MIPQEIKATLFFLNQGMPDNYTGYVSEDQWQAAFDLIEQATVTLPFMPVIGWHIDVGSLVREQLDYNTLNEEQCRGMSNISSFKIRHIEMTKNGFCLYLDHPSIYLNEYLDAIENKG
jgi:hypothetical protein